MADEFTVLQGVGGDQEYYGPDDPRWSQPQPLGLADKRVLPLDGPAQLVLYPPAELAQILRGYPLKPHQRLLEGADVAGQPLYWVVNAVFRQPPLDSLMSGTLHELPSQVQLTQEEMEILGPWLSLQPLATKTGSLEYHLFDLGPDPLDSNHKDGIDHLFRTSYDWDNPKSMAKFLQGLLHFQLVRLGAKTNPLHWATDFDEDRLCRLMTLVEDQCHKLNPRTWEKIKENAFYALVGIPSTLFISGAFHGAARATGAWAGGISALLSPAKWSYQMAQKVVAYLGPKLAPRVAQMANVAKGLTGLGVVRVLAPVSVVSLGDMVGGISVSTYMHASGTADDPNYRLMRYAYDQMIAELAGRPIGFFFGHVIQGMQGAAALVSDNFERELFEGIDLKINSFINSSDRFGDAIVDQLLRFVLESQDRHRQIDSRVLRKKVQALYQGWQQKIWEAYELLQLTGHRALRGQCIRELIEADGTIRDFGLLKSHLRTVVIQGKHPQRKSLLPLLQGGGLSATAPILGLAPVKPLQAPAILATGGAALLDMALDDDQSTAPAQTVKPRSSRPQRFRGPMMSTRSPLSVRTGSLARVGR